MLLRSAQVERERSQKEELRSETEELRRGSGKEVHWSTVHESAFGYLILIVMARDEFTARG